MKIRIEKGDFTIKTFLGWCYLTFILMPSIDLKIRVMLSNKLLYRIIRFFKRIKKFEPPKESFK
jgi:hypothetical protein